MPPAQAAHQRPRPGDHSVAAYANALLALVIDTRWSNTSMNLILNEPNETRRHELIDSWLTHRFADLDRISITAVLVAGVISSAFSWYNIASSPWSTKAFWYAGLIFAMSSITTAGVHSAGLHRLGVHPAWQSKIRQTLGSPLPSNPNIWRPRALQPLMWQTPNFLLKLGITCFLLGLVILIWDAAKRGGVGLGDDDAKIAIFFTFAVAISLLLYVVSVLGLFFKTAEP